MSHDVVQMLQPVPVNLLTDPSLWSVEDVIVWLQWLGLEDLTTRFEQDGVDGSTLLAMPSGRFENPLLEEAIIPLRQRHYNQQNRCILRVIDGTGLRRGGANSAGRLASFHEALDNASYFFVPSGASGGRNSASNVVVLHENFVSRRHFKLEYIEDDDIPSTSPMTGSTCRNGKWYLSDLGSTTGTFMMVKDWMLLKDGMILQIGISEIVVHGDERNENMQLEVTEGPNIGTILSLQKGYRLSIGRDQNCALCINDIQISAVHAQVYWTSSSNAFILEDQFSTNRTWVRLSRESRSSLPISLDVGDVFKVGSTWFQHVEEGSEDPAEDAPGDVACNESLGPNAEEYAVLLRVARLRMRASRGRQNMDSSLLRSSGFDSSQGFDFQSPVLPSQPCPSALVDTEQQLLAQQRQLEMQLNNSSAQIRYARNRQGVKSGADDTTSCKICYDNKMECVFVPCGHFMCCVRCGDRVSECPVCRAAISMIQRVYA